MDEHSAHAPEFKDEQRSRRRVAVLIPAATFLVGVLLGGLVVSASTGSGDTGAIDDPAASGPDNESASPSAGTAVVVPAACQEAADAIGGAADLLRDAARSVRDFDPDRLVETLDELEVAEPRARELARQCAAIDVSPVSPTTQTP